MTTLGVAELERLERRRGQSRRCAAKHRAKRTPEEKEAVRQYMVSWRARNPEKVRAYGRDRWEGLREIMFANLGRQCTCCGIDEPAFLTLDHVNGDGQAHRKSLGGPGASYHVYEDARRQGWPRERYQVLCWNCNLARRWGRQCPHRLLQ